MGKPQPGNWFQPHNIPLLTCGLFAGHLAAPFRKHQEMPLSAMDVNCCDYTILSALLAFLLCDSLYRLRGVIFFQMLKKMCLLLHSIVCCQWLMVFSFLFFHFLVSEEYFEVGISQPELLFTDVGVTFERRGAFGVCQSGQIVSCMSHCTDQPMSLNTH